MAEHTMFTSLISFVENTLIPLGSLGVFSAALLEQLFPLIPSSLVMLLSGFLFLSPEPFLSLSFFLTLFLKIILPIVMGGTLGSLLFYFLAYKLGKPVIEHWGKFLGVSWSEIERAEAKLQSSPVDELAFLAMTSVPILPTSIPTVLAGVLRYPLYKYLPLLAIGMGLRASFYGILGSRAGALYYEHVALISTLENYLVGVLVLGFILVGFWWAYRRLRRA